MLFLKPQREAPRIYRELVAAALPRIREHAPDAEGAGRRDRAGRASPARRSARPSSCAAGCAWTRTSTARWSIARAHRSRGSTSTASRTIPTGPRSACRRRRTSSACWRSAGSGRYLDRAARAGRMPLDLPIYNTEFGLQSNPPDPTVSTTLARQAALINEKEELSYRYPRLRSYSQYLMYDDPPRPRATDERAVWSGFQTGLRFTDGRRKPALGGVPAADRRAHARRRRGCWSGAGCGRASGSRTVQLERARAAARWRPARRASRRTTPATSRRALPRRSATATAPSTATAPRHEPRRHADRLRRLARLVARG